MRITFSRWTILGTLCAMLTFASASGCRGGGWGWSSPSWMSWGGSKPDEALIVKPSTTVPKPSSTTTPSPTTSIAAGTGGPSITAPTYTASTASPYGSAGASYPTTPQAYTYPTQPAAAYQQPGAANQVAPTVGYQTGPYSMNSQPAATGQPGYPASGAASQSWNTAPAPAAGDNGGYRTADQRSMYGAQEPSPYSTSQAAPGYGASGYGAPTGYGAPSSYGAAPATATTPAPYGAPASATPGYGAPSTATGGSAGYAAPGYDYRSSAPATTAPAPASGYSAPASSGASQPGYGTGGYGGASATAPAPVGSTAVPAANVPAALATDASSYRPGSTAGSYNSVQNASYSQPAYGNTYLR